MYEGFASEFTKFPKNIYVNADDVQSAKSPEDLISPGSGPLAEKLVNFTRSLSSLVRGNITSLSLDDLWLSANDKGAMADTTLYDLTSNLYGNLTTYEQWSAFSKDYLLTYMKSHDGAYPYMVPSTLLGWKNANSSISPAFHKEDIRKKKQVAEWVSKSLFKPDEDTCSDSIFLYVSYPQGAYSYKPDVTSE